VTINLLWAWVLTIPVSALLAAIVYFIVNLVSKDNNYKKSDIRL
jgi:PiT family inorganic phosphate transporter